MSLGIVRRGAALQALRPGGLLLVRDHGLYDITQLRIPAERQVGPRLYRRLDGTLCYFFRYVSHRTSVRDLQNTVDPPISHKHCASITEQQSSRLPDQDSETLSLPCTQTVLSLVGCVLQRYVCCGSNRLLLPATIDANLSQQHVPQRWNMPADMFARAPQMKRPPDEGYCLWAS